MIATGLECIPGRRAQRRGVEIIVGDTLSGKCIKSRCLNRTTKGTRTTEAYVVNQHNYNIREDKSWD